MKDLVLSFGPVTYFAIVILFEVIPIKIGASLVRAERSDWGSCMIVSLIAGVFAFALGTFTGTYTGIVIYVVKAGIISAVLGVDIISAVVVSIVAGLAGTGLLFGLLFLMGQFA